MLELFQYNIFAVIYFKLVISINSLGNDVAVKLICHRELDG